MVDCLIEFSGKQRLKRNLNLLILSEMDSDERNCFMPGVFKGKNILIVSVSGIRNPVFLWPGFLTNSNNLYNIVLMNRLSLLLFTSPRRFCSKKF